MQKHPISKYRPYPTIELPDRQWPDKPISSCPIWSSVDLRDGNQALPIPMTVEEKLELFDLLVKTGFKEIEIGFPSASDTEFNFARRLIEEDRIPEGVSVQVLVQCREHLIRRTFEAIRGAPAAIVHFYNSTNPLQRRVTFGKTKEEIKTIAVEGAKLVRRLADEEPESERIRFQYSPESFTDTELPYALEVCEAVMDAIKPTPTKPLILNLPATVELFTPNLHADQIEWFSRNVKQRDSIIISLHTHNDRGTGVAASELGLMAGAQRVEGTLFGNGERTGNLDIVTVALNLYTQGIDPELDFSNLGNTRSIYEKCTRMTVHDRHPYAGDLVFTAFSGSHQDAIKKGIDVRGSSQPTPPDDRWAVPYLPIDPADIGRSYQAIIRINSQSGKGGVAYILEREFGIEMPKLMHPEFGQLATNLADERGSELDSTQIKGAFQESYLDLKRPLELVDYELKHASSTSPVEVKASVNWEGKKHEISGSGIGPIAAFIDALKAADWKDFKLLDYSQKAVTKGSTAKAVSFVLIERLSDEQTFWGASLEANVESGSLLAIVSAVNRSRANR
jgi:2-isopropylmalate synthase|tara:strand:+ start:940 stop:2631 length:1692 start_codon:yes stop_codon:yes gene_type:complete